MSIRHINSNECKRRLLAFLIAYKGPLPVIASQRQREQEESDIRTGRAQ